MAGGVDGNVGWPNDLQLVRVQRAGGRGADIHFFIRDIERAFAIDRGPWQGIDAGDVSMRAPSHELSTRPAHSAADDNAALFVRDVRTALSRQRNRLLSRRLLRRQRSADR